MHDLVWPAIVVAFLAIVVRSFVALSRQVNDGALLGMLRKLFLAGNADRAGKLLEAAGGTVLGAALLAVYRRSRQDADTDAWRRAFDETFARRARVLIVTAPIPIVLVVVALGAVAADAIDTGRIDPAPLVALGIAVLVGASLVRAEVRLFKRARKNRDAFVHIIQSAPVL